MLSLEHVPTLQSREPESKPYPRNWLGVWARADLSMGTWLHEHMVMINPHGKISQRGYPQERATPMSDPSQRTFDNPLQIMASLLHEGRYVTWPQIVFWDVRLPSL